MRGAVFLVVFVVGSFLPEVVGAIGTLPEFARWYTHSPRLDWSPPLWVFQLVWPTIYLSLGVAGWLVWKRFVHPQRRVALALYVTQAVLQVVWMLAFLVQAAVDGSAIWAVFAVIVLLDIVVAATAIAFFPISRIAAALMWIALCWLLYGTALSLGDTVLIWLSR